jgi:hypothetical protein
MRANFGSGTTGAGKKRQRREAAPDTTKSNALRGISQPATACARIFNATLTLPPSLRVFVFRAGDPFLVWNLPPLVASLKLRSVPSASLQSRAGISPVVYQPGVVRSRPLKKTRPLHVSRARKPRKSECTEPQALGEELMGPAGAAIANALFDATGVQLREYPLTPDVSSLRCGAEKRSVLLRGCLCRT